MEISELKKAVHKDLTAEKEKERLERVEKNSKLTEVTVYTRPKNPTCEALIKTFEQEGIKFIDKDINTYPEILATVQLNAVPIVFVNDNYLVQGRDFQNQQQLVNALQYLGDPDLQVPSSEDRLLEHMKTNNYQLHIPYMLMIYYLQILLITLHLFLQICHTLID